MLNKFYMPTVDNENVRRTNQRVSSNMKITSEKREQELFTKRAAEGELKQAH